MEIHLTNAQRAVPVAMGRVHACLRRAIRALRITTRGTLAVTFVSGPRMRQLHRRFCGADRVTDVLSFRYEGEPTVGEVFVAPSVARQYARTHRIPYAEELTRYVVHGLLHWRGYDDGTPAQRRIMRRMEDRLLAAGRDLRHETRDERQKGHHGPTRPCRQSHVSGLRFLISRLRSRALA